jgi:hypothetical protein
MKTSATKWKACELMLKEGIVCRITVTGHSMRPLLRSGDIIEISPYKGNRTVMGDVVLAKEQAIGRYLVHRIIKRFKDGSCLLKGDNCENDDNIFTKSEILGKVRFMSKEKKFLYSWPAAQLIALASRGGRKMVTHGLAVKNLLCR